MQAHDGIANHRGHLRDLAFAFFDGLQRLAAQIGGARRFLFKELRGFRVQVPAQIIKPWFVREFPHLFQRFLLHLAKRNHHVRHLHAGVINVVLHGNFVARVAQHPHHRVAQHRIAQVPDVRGLVGIDAGVLDDDPAERWVHAARRAAGFGTQVLPKRPAIEKRVQVAATGHLHACNARYRRQRARDFLRDLPRRFLQPLSQLKAHRRSRFAEFQLRRPLQRDVDLAAVLLPYVRAERFSQPLDDCQIHSSPVYCSSGL